jgi:hypothetical protein
MVLAPDDGAADGALGRVVVERDARIVDEPREPIPVGERVRGGLADGQRLEGDLVPQPVLECSEHGGRFAATQLGHPSQVALGATIDLVERTDPREGGADAATVAMVLAALGAGGRR